MTNHTLCECCTDERAIEIAHEIIGHVVQKYYGLKNTGPDHICSGSLNTVMHVAHFYARAILAQTYAQSSEEYGIFSAPIAFEAVNHVEAKTREFLLARETGPNAGKDMERLIAMMDSVHELQEADEAFNKEQKGG